jgi:elongation factor P
MALSYTELTKGTLFVLDGQPWEVLEMNFLRMQQRKAVVQTRIKNLVTGKIVDRNFQGSDSFEEAEIEKKPAMFIFVNKGEYWFHEEGNPKNRFQISGDLLGNAAQFLKPNTKVATVLFEGNVIGADLPVKMDFKVIEAPPGIKGNTAQGGMKSVTIEGGAKVNTPLFVNEGDVIRINTQTGQYVERV